MKLEKILRHCRIDKPRHFRLARHEPAERFGLSPDAAEVKDMLADGIARLEKLQQRLYADGRWSVLIVFQGMDAAGKDSAIKHVMSGVNPQGCEVHGFKEPSTEELAHDFLWRAAQRLPARGSIGIFNRSYYEEVLVVRVHPELLQRQKLPPGHGWAGHLEAPLQGDSGVRAASHPQRHLGAEIPFAHFQGRAAQALSGADRRAGEALEVFHERYQRARALGPLYGGV